MKADVIIIGGGMAGTVAALRAAELGADVLLIRKGHGTSAMSSGTVDIAGPERFLPSDPWNSLPTIADRLQEILRINSLHPYSIIAGGRDGLEHLVPRLRQACDFMLAKIPSLELRGSLERNLALANVFGTVKFCAFAPESLIGGDLTEMRDARLLLVGINGLPLFRPHMCKQALERYSSLHPPHPISSIDVIETDIPHSADSSPNAPFQLAHRLDDPQVSEEFAKAVSEKTGPSVTHVGLPPVLGLNNHTEAFGIINRELQPKTFELISPNFSVPGYRLQASLDTALRNSTVRAFTAEIVEMEPEGRLVKNLLFGDVRSKRSATAKNFVVATGKFSSGGLVAGDFPNEPIFGLPLYSYNERVDGKFVQDLLTRKVDSRQLFLSCGIHIDRSLRPLDPFDEPAFENLFAAGSILGGYDYVADKCGFGVAVLTGYLAGEKAAA